MGPIERRLRRTEVEPFRHEAFLYRDRQDLLDRIVAFVQKGVAAGEPTLVALPGGPLKELRSALETTTDHARLVDFVDMGVVGKNPARLIPLWRNFLANRAHAPRVRGVGEPTWVGRSPDELAECRHHETLINLAFGHVPGLTLLCPYDAAAHDPAVLADACYSHPFVTDHRAQRPSPDYADIDTARLLGEPLPPAPEGRPLLVFRSARSVRQFVAEHAAGAGDLLREKVDDMVLAVNELAANSIRHGGGSGTVSAWALPGQLIYQVDDQGWITDPLVGRRHPVEAQRDGRGLWLVNQLCDLTQLRSSPRGTTIRLHFSLRAG